MLFVAPLRLALSITPLFLLFIQESKSIPQYYPGQSWSGNGNGYGNIWATDNVNAGFGGTGGTIVSQEVKGDGTIIERNGWNKGFNGNAGFMKGIGGSGGYFGQPGFGGSGRGQLFGGAGVNGGLGANGGTTVIRKVGEDGSYIYGKQNNIGLGGNLGTGIMAGGMGGGSGFGPCGFGACGHGGVRGWGDAGVNGGLNANHGYTVQNQVLPNGGFVKTTNSNWGVNGNIGTRIGIGGDGGWRGKVGQQPSGRSMYMDDDLDVPEVTYPEPTYVQPPDYYQPQQVEHPYMRTLEGMYSREMNPQASIIMIDDPVVIIMPDEEGESAEGRNHDGDDDSSTKSSTPDSSTEGGSSTTSATSTEGGSSTASATSTEGGSSTTAASSTDGSTTDGSTTEGETTTEGDETTTEGDETTTEGDETTTDGETTTEEE